MESEIKYSEGDLVGYRIYNELEHKDLEGYVVAVSETILTVTLPTEERGQLFYHKEFGLCDVKDVEYSDILCLITPGDLFITPPKHLIKSLKDEIRNDQREDLTQKGEKAYCPYCNEELKVDEGYKGILSCEDCFTQAQRDNCG